MSRLAGGMPRAWTAHWPEYAMEAAGLGAFMLSACLFATLVFHPDSPVARNLAPVEQRALMGLAMGLTLVALVYSPWGLRSGAHLNPAFTLAFLRMGKVRGADAGGYIGAHFIGAAGGVMLAALLLGHRIGDATVNYVVTVPGAAGVAAALGGEVLISALQMTLVLHVSNTPRLARWTGVCAGAMLALYILVESPISGTSMNPARTFGSALGGNVWTAIWLYLVGPLSGMLLAAELYLHRGRRASCAKMVHLEGRRCIFCREQGTEY